MSCEYLVQANKELERQQIKRFLIKHVIMLSARSLSECHIVTSDQCNQCQVPTLSLWSGSGSMVTIFLFLINKI